MSAPRLYPADRPWWLGTGQPWPCARCLREEDAEDPHPCPSVVCPIHGVEHYPDREAR